MRRSCCAGPYRSQIWYGSRLHQTTTIRGASCSARIRFRSRRRSGATSCARIPPPSKPAGCRRCASERVKFALPARVTLTRCRTSRLRCVAVCAKPRRNRMNSQRTELKSNRARPKRAPAAMCGRGWSSGATRNSGLSDMPSRRLARSCRCPAYRRQSGSPTATRV